MTEREDELVAELCKIIVNSRDYVDASWDAIAVVCDVHDYGSTNVHGYSFTLDPAARRSWKPSAPDASKALFDALRSLNGAVLERTGEKWKTCLVQIVREGMKFSIDFEYDTKDRWFPMPGELGFEEFPMSINPLLDDTTTGSG